VVAVVVTIELATFAVEFTIDCPSMDVITVFDDDPLKTTLRAGGLFNEDHDFVFVAVKLLIVVLMGITSK